MLASHFHRSGLNDLYSASQKSLDSEMKLRLQTEREMEDQKKLRAETEVGRLVSWLSCRE